MKKLKRRNFLKLIGAAITAPVALSKVASTPIFDKEKVILSDAVKESKAIFERKEYQICGQIHDSILLIKIGCSQGLYKMESVGQIEIGDMIFFTEDGKVTAKPDGCWVGIAMESNKGKL